MRRSSIPLIVILIGACALALTVVAAPPPLQLCGVCHGTFDGATERGTLDISLDEEGNAAWVERVPLADPDSYTDDEVARESLVSEAWVGWHVSRGAAPERWDHTISNGDLVVTYSMDDIATPGVGNAWVVRFFDTRETIDRYQIGGEQLRIHPPAGYAFTNRPTGATIDDGAAIWQGADTDRMESDLPKDVVLTYAPELDRTGSVAGFATRAVAIGPTVAWHTLLAGAVPMVVLALGVAGATRFRSQRTPVPSRYSTILAVGSLGIALLTIPLAFHFDDPGWAVVTLGALAYAVIARPAFEVRHRFGAHLLLGLVIGWMTITMFLVTAVVGWAPLLIGGPVLASLAFAPLSVALRTGQSPLPSILIILLAPVVGVATVMPTTSFGLVVIATYRLVTATGALLAGWGLFVIDHRDRGQLSNRQQTE